MDWGRTEQALKRGCSNTSGNSFSRKDCQYLTTYCGGINTFYSLTYHFHFILQFREAAMSKDDTELLRVMANYGM
jgi:hypothetical protein